MLPLFCIAIFTCYLASPCYISMACEDLMYACSQHTQWSIHKAVLCSCIPSQIIRTCSWFRVLCAMIKHLSAVVFPPSSFRVLRTTVSVLPGLRNFCWERQQFVSLFRADSRADLVRSGLFTLFSSSSIASSTLTPRQVPSRPLVAMSTAMHWRNYITEAQIYWS